MEHEAENKYVFEEHILPAIKFLLDEKAVDSTKIFTIKIGNLPDGLTRDVIASLLNKNGL